jgi:hypothetical protein
LNIEAELARPLDLLETMTVEDAMPEVGMESWDDELWAELSKLVVEKFGGNFLADLAE